MEKHPIVYILASKSGVLYVGVTSDILWRVWKHKTKVFEGFTKRYNVDRLLFFERHMTMREAIVREKAIKGWRRSKKADLINESNPLWEDLAEKWFDDSSWCWN